jgi:hypothetical protein
LPAHSIHNILPYRLVGEFVRDQNNDDDGRQDQDVTYTGKKSDILPHFRKEIEGKMWEGDRTMLVDIIYPTVQGDPRHQDSQDEEKKIQPHEDPEDLISHDLF